MAIYDNSRRANVHGAHPAAVEANAAALAPEVYPRRGGSSRARGAPCRVYTASGTRTIGVIVEGRNGPEVVKRVRESRHLLRVADAWGVDLRLVERARAEGVGRIRLDEVERGISYSTSPEHLLAHGFRRDFGHGLQVFLPRSLWSQSCVGQLELPTG